MMSRKVKIGFLIGLLVSLLSVVVWAINPQFAFELDGNTKIDTGPGPDWNLMNGDCTVRGGGSGNPDGTGTGPGGGSPFKGVHVDGDVFLVSAFVNGGGTAQLAAYIWNAPGGAITGGCAHGDIVKTPVVGQCAADNLEFLGFSDTYAITNSNVLPAADVSWSYDAKFGGSTSDPIPAGGFFEGGADLSALFANTGVGDVP